MKVFLYGQRPVVAIGQHPGVPVNSIIHLVTSGSGPRQLVLNLVTERAAPDKVVNHHVRLSGRVAVAGQNIFQRLQ